MAQRVSINYVQFYTQGSAAKQVAPAISVHTGALPQVKKRKVRRVVIDPVAIMGSLVAVCMAITVLIGWSNLQAEQKKTQTMIAYVAQLQQENEALHTQYDAECDLEKIEQTALALGMIPREDAARIEITVELPPQQQEAVSIWQQIGTFLTGLYA